MILKRVTSQNLITPRKVKENPAARVINLRQMNVYKDVDRPLALTGHVTSFLWKWKLYDFSFEKPLVGHILNKIIVIWFFKPVPFT